MSDINRLLILLILVGLLVALYKYQDTILGNLDSLQLLPAQLAPAQLAPTQLAPTQLAPTQQPPLQLQNSVKPQRTNKKEKEITADNISQISILSLNDKNNFDINSLSNSDNMSIILDDNTCDTMISKQTYGSLFDN